MSDDIKSTGFKYLLLLADFRIYKMGVPRDIARMVEKLDQFEIQREITAMLDSFEKPVQREIMAGLAARYGFDLKDKQAGGGSGPRPTYRKKRAY